MRNKSLINMHKIIEEEEEENEETRKFSVFSEEWTTEEIIRLENKDNSHWQFDKLAPVWIVFALFVIQTIFKDGDMANVENCSFEFWAIYCVYTLI